MVGLTVEISMRMRGKITETKVIVLIDSGATNNFISEQVVRAIGLPVAESRWFGVSVGNGKIILGQEKFSRVMLAIQGVEIVEEFLLFEL